MDYLKALNVWCMRRGVAAPKLQLLPDGVAEITFNGEVYDGLGDTEGAARQAAAAHAYCESGVFGRVVQYGFIPAAGGTTEVIVDAAHASPNAVANACAHGGHVAVFCAFNDNTEFPQGTFTVYHTEQATDEAYAARLQWYIESRSKTWNENGTRVIIYSNCPWGDALRRYVLGYAPNAEVVFG